MAMEVNKTKLTIIEPYQPEKEIKLVERRVAVEDLIKTSNTEIKLKEVQLATPTPVETKTIQEIVTIDPIKVQPITVEKIFKIKKQ